MINPTMIKFTIMLLNSTGVIFDRFKDSWSGTMQEVISSYRVLLELS